MVKRGAIADYGDFSCDRDMPIMSSLGAKSQEIKSQITLLFCSKVICDR